MDNKLGNFEEINEEKFIEQMKQPEPRVFKVGEALKLRGSCFEVLEITPVKLILGLVGDIMDDPYENQDTFESLKKQIDDLHEDMEYKL